MIAWIKRWWAEGDDDRAQLKAAEAQLHDAIKERTALSVAEAVVSQHETNRVRSLVDEAIKAVKRGEELQK